MMTSTTRLQTRALAPTSPSSYGELQRLREKLAFYEQPITSFNRPVQNDPADAAYAEFKLSQAIHKRETSTGVRTCFVTRIARRAIAAMRSLFSQRRHRYADPTRRGDMTFFEKQQMITKPVTSTRARGLPRALHGHVQEMDEGTRYRLELAGIQVKSPPPSYTVCV